MATTPYPITLLNLTAIVQKYTPTAYDSTIGPSTTSTVSLIHSNSVFIGRKVLNEDSLSAWWTLILFIPLAICGIVGNTLVCVAIYTDKRLQNVTNYFLFSLAVADLLVCIIVMPLTIAVELRSGEWFGEFWSCLVYVYADVFLCSTSIVHMCVISLDRYLGISQPFKSRNKSPRVVFTKIVVVWVISVLISCPIVVLALKNEQNVFSLLPESKSAHACFIDNGYYMIFGSIFAFLIPFMIMIVTYIRTTSLLREQARLLSNGDAGASPTTDMRRGSKVGADGLYTQNVTRSNGLRRTITGNPEKKKSYIPSPVVRRATDACVDRSRGNSLQTDTEMTDLPLNNNLNEPDRCRSTSVTHNEQDRPKISQSSNDSTTTTAASRFKKRTTNIVVNLVRRAGTKLSRSRAAQELANEEKATRVLAVVFLCFFVCWTPFFFINFLVGFCGDSCVPPPKIMSLVLWMGYISSILNPIIYTIFNRKFRQSFVRILHCRCSKASRAADDQRQYVNYRQVTNTIHKQSQHSFRAHNRHQHSHNHIDAQTITDGKRVSNPPNTKFRTEQNLLTTKLVPADSETKPDTVLGSDQFRQDTNGNRVKEISSVTLEPLKSRLISKLPPKPYRVTQKRSICAEPRLRPIRSNEVLTSDCDTIARHREFQNQPQSAIATLQRQLTFDDSTKSAVTTWSSSSEDEDEENYDAAEYSMVDQKATKYSPSKMPRHPSTTSSQMNSSNTLPVLSSRVLRSSMSGDSTSITNQIRGLDDSKSTDELQQSVYLLDDARLMDGQAPNEMQQSRSPKLVELTCHESVI